MQDAALAILVRRRTRATSDCAKCCTAATGSQPNFDATALLVDERTAMSNPWTKKNPLMSMWLSSANKAMNTARGHATSAAKRQVATAQTDAMRQIVDFWTGKPGKAPARKKTRR